MTFRNRRESEHPDPARHLDAYLDDLGSGVLAPRNEIEPDIAAIASQLLQVGDGTTEPLGLRTQLWEDLMSAATPLDANNLAAPPIPSSKPPGKSPGNRPTLLGTPRSSGNARPANTLLWLAAALVLLTVLGAGLIGRSSGDDPTPTNPASALSAATPTASCNSTSDGSDSDCPNIVEQLGTNFLSRDAMADADQNVELQGWAIIPGESLIGVQAPSGTFGGVIDFVLSGAYSATFSSQAVIGRAGFSLTTYEYIEAGETVELARGDTVSYQLGSLVEVHNPLTERRLEFKRAVIYVGDISVFSISEESVTVHVDGSRTIPLVLSYYEIDVSLYYVQRPQGSDLLPSWWSTKFILGPVDPQSGSDGFVLVIGPMMG